MIAAVLAVGRTKEFHAILDIFVWLCSINAGFWILARVMGALVDIFSEIIWEDLWSLLATLYNIALAVFFAAIMFVSATKGAPPRDFMWRQMCGFVLLYFALGASYMEKNTHHIGDHARPGYALGLLSYIVFAAFPRLTDYPEFLTLITVMKALADSWLGKALTVFMIGGIIWGIVHRGLREMFYHLSPFLWFIGALKHPPIRVRRSKS